MGKLIFGIDLGTTYSCIAYVDELGQSTVAKNSEGDAITPSVVQFEDDGNLVVGNVAKENAMMYPTRTKMFVKNEMGSNDPAIVIDDKEYRPEEISALILKKVAKDAGITTNTEVKDVVITCPAYFGDAERQATKKAGEIANLNVIDIINEPTAAAFYYGCNNQDENKNIMVYDLGGGTFDVTVMHIENGNINVICSEGNKSLGGKDWDEAIIQFILGESNISKEDLDDEEEKDLYITAEKVKKYLTSKEKQKFQVTLAGQRKSMEITREQFDNITNYLLAQTMDLVDMCINNAKTKGVDKIDKILLVGGSTRMPQVEKTLKEKYRIETIMHDPDESVAKGAAIYALCKYQQKAEEFAQKKKTNTSFTEKEKKEMEKYAIPAAINTENVPYLAGKNLSEIVISTTTKSYAVEVVTEDDRIRYSNVIKKNMPLENGKSEFSKTFSTNEDNQTSAEIKIFETDNESDIFDLDDDNKEDFCLGKFSLKLSGHEPKGSPVNVSICLHEDGTLLVSAIDNKTGNKEEATMQSKGGSCMTEVEVIESRNALSVFDSSL